MYMPTNIIRIFTDWVVKFETLFFRHNYVLINSIHTKEKTPLPSLFSPIRSLSNESPTIYYYLPSSK